MPDSPEIKKISIDELTPDPKNARKQTERSHWMQSESFSRFGAGRSIVIDENGMILAGHGATQAAADLGIKEVIVVPTDGNTLVAVQRTDLSAGDKKAYAIADNRTSDLSTWDPLVLAQLNLDPEVDLSDWFKEDELQSLITPMELQEEQSEEEPQGITCPHCGAIFQLGDKAS